MNKVLTSKQVYDTLKPYRDKICLKPKRMLMCTTQFWNVIAYSNFSSSFITIIKNGKRIEAALNFRVPINRIVKELEPDTLEVKGYDNEGKRQCLHCKMNYTYIK